MKCCIIDAIRHDNIQGFFQISKQLHGTNLMFGLIV